MLKLRFLEMRSHHFFEHMLYSEEHDEIKSWIPYTMENRPRAERMAATRIDTGTDVNFQSLTEQMASWLERQPKVNIHYHSHVRQIHKGPSGAWLVEACKDGEKQRFKADILFVGAGGGAFPLLKQTHLPDQRRFAGFPVGGRFLRTRIAPEQAREYDAKTYGKAKVGAPPMSVPHLDLRNDKGQYYLLFGPFASFMPILEKGRGFLEYLRSVRPHDIPNLLNVLVEHFPLLRYLVRETFQSKAAMLQELENFAPGMSRKFNWEVIQAGQRVQIIKDGYLQMGTEIVVSDDRSFGTLLGASPGASVSPEVMLRLVEQLFPFLVREPAVQERLQQMFPVADIAVLERDAALYRKVRDDVNTVLGLAG
jgi:malate dehydrogenase (quinone)